MGYLVFNGELIPENEFHVSANNRSFRYGDGFFETMKVTEGELVLKSYHFERLFSSMETLGMVFPQKLTAYNIEQQVLLLCNENQITQSARVRINIYREDSELYSISANRANYVIQASSLDAPDNDLRWRIDIYPDAFKACDRLANIKSNNFLPYVMAAIYAKKNKLDDCLLLNSAGRVCDSTRANVFWIKDETVFTTPLSEGCISGVMRKHLIERMSVNNYKFFEQPITPSELLTAQEIFLTNVIMGIRSVSSIANKPLHHSITGTLINLLITAG